ncbi:unnamed protein product, partial [Symbiodinium microadriaticum]
MAPSLHCSRLSHDRSEGIVLESAESHPGQDKAGRRVHHYVYVDNLGILSVNKDTVEQGLVEVEKIFEQRHLVLHPGIISTGSTKALGCDLRGDLLASRITPERYHRLYQAICAVLQRKRISGRLLEVIIGQATFAGLMCRPTLSVFNTVYRYINSCCYKPCVLWESARQELKAFKGLMIFLHADWTRPWNPYVTATDSSLQGFGIVSSFWRREEVAQVGRTLERSRFRKLGSHSARDSALQAAGFTKDEITNAWKVGEIDSDTLLHQHGWELEKSFAEVPGHLLKADRWKPCLWGRWSREAGILELEVRALVKGLRRVALSTFGSHVGQLILCDNMSVVLAFDRSRARNFKLLLQIRRFTAYCLARNIMCTVRWVPSELNSADEPSRLHSDEASKGLAHVIPAIKWAATRADPEAAGATAIEAEADSSPSPSKTVSGSQKCFKDASPRGSQSPRVPADPGDNSPFQLGGRATTRGVTGGSEGKERARDESPSGSTSATVSERRKKKTALLQRHAKRRAILTVNHHFEEGGEERCGSDHLEAVPGRATGVLELCAPTVPIALSQRFSIDQYPEFGRMGRRMALFLLMALSSYARTWSLLLKPEEEGETVDPGQPVLLAKASPPFYRNKCQGKYVMDLFSGLVVAGGRGSTIQGVRRGLFDPDDLHRMQVKRRSQDAPR